MVYNSSPETLRRPIHEFIRLTGMTHVRTSPYYPQSNDKVERYHKIIKGGAIRLHPPATLEEARETITRFFDLYNNTRLHCAIGYITPHDRLGGGAGTPSTTQLARVQELSVPSRKPLTDSLCAGPESLAHAEPVHLK